MERMYVRILLVGLLTQLIIACSDSNTQSGSVKAPSEQLFNPGIDTAAITDKETMLAAARQLKSVIEQQEKLKADPTYKQRYYVILKYKGILSKKMSAIVDTMPGNLRQALMNQYREIMP